MAAAAANAALIELRDVVLPIVGLLNVGPIDVRQTTQFMTFHGLVSVNGINLLEPDQAKDLVKQYGQRFPASSMGTLVQNNLTGLIWHVKDRNRRGLPFDINTFGINDLYRGHLAYVAYVQNRDKGDNIKALEKWSDKVEFDDWDRKVTETLSLVYGRNYCPIAYVIRPDRPAGWDPAVDATTDYERLMYQLPLVGIAYEQDNEAVFSMIQLAVVHTPAETWIYDYVAGRDGRGAMQALRNHYEGEAELDVRATKAQQTLNTLVYTNEKAMAFEVMITKLNKAYNALKRQGQEYTDRTKVEQLAARIKNPTHNVAITVAIETMREMYKNDYTGATQFITSRMAAINTAHVNAPGNNTRRVSQVSSADLARTSWNNVDISDHWRKFTEDEWFKLGARGQEIVTAKRRARNGGRSHGGYGRGGRGGRFNRGGRYSNRGGRGGRGGRGNDNNQSNDERNVNEAASGDRDAAPVQSISNNSSSNVSTVTSNSQASANGNGSQRGGQNGNRFGSNRP